MDGQSDTRLELNPIWLSPRAGVMLNETGGVDQRELRSDQASATELGTPAGPHRADFNNYVPGSLYVNEDTPLMLLIQLDVIPRLNK